MQSKRGRKNAPPRLYGTGYDNKDGHRRVTKAESILIVGGSKETHERMQDEAIRMNEEAAKRGKTLREVSSRELGEIVEKVITS